MLNKIVDGTHWFWEDENGNRWNSANSRDEAERKSDSLVNCKDCVDCEYCEDCVGCIDCKYCIDCASVMCCENCISWQGAIFQT